VIVYFCQEGKQKDNDMKKLIKDYSYTEEELCQIVLAYDRDYIEGLGMAPNNTSDHQIIQTNILQNYLVKFGRRDILTETRLSDEVKITPDISIWEKVKLGEVPVNPLLTIEITHNIRNDRYSEKNVYASFKCFPSLQEAFVYNYDSDVWMRYRRTDKGVEKESGKDFSRLLGCYLHTLL
jgi:hypothetical protein